MRDKEVVLTFDDDPWPGNTPAVLKALAGECLKAIFFEIGEHATWHPEITKQVIEAGMTVGTHTWSHKDLARNPYAKDIEQAKAEIEMGVSAVHMAAGGGKVINIGSMMSIFGASFAPAYAASKGGIVQFTRACACAWAADNIQANAILPGWIDTNLTKRARVEVGGLHERVLARTPAARWGAIDDFAGIAVFLASRASDFVTGTAIPIDGGFSVMG